MDRLPLNGRGVLTLLEMAPGTNVVPATRGDAGQFTANGQRPNTNYFTIDGISANTGVTAGGQPAQSTGGALPALSAFGSMDSIISLEAVEEFRVTTSTAVAEFGRLPGATLTFRSRSGSNEFHGATLYRIRNEALGANDWFGNQAGYQRLPQRLHDVTQTLGGPVRRNHTFFFLSYEHLSLRQPYFWRQAVPLPESRENAADWALPLLNLFPAPNRTASLGGLGEWAGFSNRPAGLDTAGLRVDQALGSRITVFGRYNYAPSRNEFGALTVNRLHLRSRSATLGWTARATARTLLDFRINHSQASADSEWLTQPACALAPTIESFAGKSAPCDYRLRFSIGGMGQIVSGREGQRRQRQFQIVQSASFQRSEHTLAFGADYRAIRAIRRDPGGALGLIAGGVEALDDKDKLWISKSPAQNSDIHVEELSLWAMDTWRASPRLTIAAGLRWEFSPAPLPEKPVYFLDLDSALVFSTQEALWPRNYRNFAPRLGIAYRLNGNGRTVLRSGGGLYYNSSLSIATDVLNGGPLSVTSFTSGIHSPFSSELSYGFMPGLRLPSVAQWNIALEQMLGAHDVVSLGYLGSAGRHLLRRELGGLGSTPTSMVVLTTNHGQSDYHALALQYRRRLARSVQASATYTWSHSIDNDSSDAFLVWAGPGPSDRGASDFDLRHSFTGTASYEPAFLHGWALDAVVRARSGFPVTLLQSEEYLGINLSNAFRPDLALAQPLWLADPQAPGGRQLNPQAFLPTKPQHQGMLGRNALVGFGMWQLDVGLRREFRFTEHLRLHVRVEAFNAFNHPNFADPVKYEDSPLFGQSSSMLNLMLGSGSPGSGLAPALQTGGARALQGSLRFQF
jgi:hypothetical protein